MIELININKSFGDKVLFDDYNLKIKRGEFVIISGDSGSGKTTLLNMIGALEKVDGIDILNKRNQLKYYRNTVGFLFRNFVLLEDKTVYQNLNIIRKNNRSGLSI